MNTRNSARGSKNSSFSRGRGSTASRNNISIELQDNISSPKPRVVHSPATTKTVQSQPRPNNTAGRTTAEQPVQRTLSSNSLPSSQLFQDIELLDNQNSISQPQIFVSHGEDFSLNPNMNPQPDYSAASCSNAPLAINTDNLNNNSTTAFDSLIALMEQTMKNTQEEFRKELSTIRQSIAQISVAPPSTSNFTNSNTPISNNDNIRFAENASRSYANGDTNVKLEKWKISYDGSASVSDFLFKVETLCTRSKCSNEHLLANFHVLLEGRAEQWYWLFMKQNRNMSYPQLRYALTKEFGHLESDHEILLKISLRKQQYKENYDDFHSSIVSMNIRLQSPLPDNTLIDIIKRNLNSNLRFLLFSTDARDLNEFRDQARKAEKVIRETKFPNPNITQSRNINELDVSIDDDKNSADIDPQLEAIQFSNKRDKFDYSKIQCWNCMSFGHSYIYCSDEIKKPFCFKCGLKGVLTPKCPNKHFQGNRKMGDMATGDTRPSQQTPSLN